MKKILLTALVAASLFIAAPAHADRGESKSCENTGINGTCPGVGALPTISCGAELDVVCPTPETPVPTCGAERGITCPEPIVGAETPTPTPVPVDPYGAEAGVDAPVLGAGQVEERDRRIPKRYVELTYAEPMPTPRFPRRSYFETNDGATYRYVTNGSCERANLVTNRICHSVFWYAR